MPDDTEVLNTALKRVRDAADGDSNDEEIEALQDALSLALRRWPEVDHDA